MSYSRTTLLGRLGKDPETRKTQTGDVVVSLSVATNERRKVDGAWTDVTSWHRVTVFGRQAEACAKHLSKGRSVLVDGTLRYDAYTDKNGVRRTATTIVAHSVVFVDGGGRGEAPDDGEIPF